MPKQKMKPAAHSSVHDDYELPAELDFSKLKPVGFGSDSLENAQRRTTIELDIDVARVFSTSESVNRILRAIIQGLTRTKKRRKSA
jgi:hypothetical protein